MKGPCGQVAPGLYIGGITALDYLQELGITHVVSVLNGAASLQDQHPQLASCQRHAVEVEDLEEANLLSSLPAAVGFITAALGGGGGSTRVLVHCVQGVSRSAAVAAAYLMASSAGAAGGGPGGLDPDAALAALRRACPAAAPNAGFVAQLQLFHAMGCRLQDGYVPYKRFLLQQAANHYQETGALPAAEALPAPAEPAGGGATLYRCRKCRCLVATAHNVVETEQGPGAAAFSWRKRDKQQRLAVDAGGGGGGEEGSLFVEPLRWMGEGGGADSVVAGAVQGKLYCPKCQARLGSFNWAGTQSSSGAWVTPAFQLHLSKLDAIESGPPAALAAIRQPRMLATSSIVGGSGSSAPPPSAAGAAAAAATALAAGLERSTWVDGPHRSAAPAGGGDGGASGGASGGSCPAFQYLVLDCDGVLVDSERMSCEALRQAILEVTGFDIPHSFPEDFQPVFGMDVWHCVEYYQQRFGKQEWGDVTGVANRVSEVKEGIYQRLTAGGITAFPGVARLVQQAQSLGLKVAVASSGSPEKIAHNLGSSGLAPLFPDPYLIVSAKHVQRGKPAPDVYLEALRRLGCADASRALVVEDAVNGLKAAKAAGCFAVAVATSLPAHMLEAHADLVLPALEGLDLAEVQQQAQQARQPTGRAGGGS
ncbi:hypothetical protein ABPG77_005619 [Micractinium sp. CCAP 211/92]